MAKQLDYTKLNPRKIRRADIDIRHTLKVSQFERLCSWLANDEGELAVGCQFEFTQDNLILMNLEITGQLNLLCKRCLEPFVFDWSSVSIVQLEDEDKQADGFFDERYEKVLMSHDGTINLIDIVTDEVILGLPNTHQTECMHELGHEF